MSASLRASRQSRAVRVRDKAMRASRSVDRGRRAARPTWQSFRAPNVFAWTRTARAYPAALRCGGSEFDAGRARQAHRRSDEGTGSATQNGIDSKIEDFDEWRIAVRASDEVVRRNFTPCQ